MSQASHVYAMFWASRSLRRRLLGWHELSNGDLAHLFGGEWGLDVVERGKLLKHLMRLEEKELAR